MVTSRSDFIKMLTLLQRMACVYSSPGDHALQTSHCDCKYGLTHVMGATETGNGCPELRELIAIINIMSASEWARLEKRLESFKKTQRKKRAALLDAVVDRAKHLTKPPAKKRKRA